MCIRPPELEIETSRVCVLEVVVGGWKEGGWQVGEIVVGVMAVGVLVVGGVEWR